MRHDIWREMRRRILCAAIAVILGITPAMPAAAANSETNGAESATSAAAEPEASGNESPAEAAEPAGKESPSEAAEPAGSEDSAAESDGSGDLVSAPSAILMEASTGKVIYEKDPDSRRHPASVTKIMTLLLIFDALEEGKIQLDDEVTTSEYAASMGGPQVFLEPGEVQTVETLIKCISVASANDACVAMAEFVCGSEEEFVKQMNARAAGLGMENTHFENCNGLDTDSHLTTARDIALMSREMLVKYPQIHDYCTIWMENITHTTKKGASEFGLTNTNKLIRHYEYATGLKTGSTSQAKFCISATAKKDDMELIAVIMAADDSTKRVRDAAALLNYGFGRCRKYEEEKAADIAPVRVVRGTQDEVSAVQEEPFSYVDTTGADLKAIERKVSVKKKVKAPVRQGEKLGEVNYYLNGEKIGSRDVLAAETVAGMSAFGAMLDVLKDMLL